MKYFFILILFLSAGFSVHAESFRLEGTPYQPTTNIEIEWNVPTNPLPHALWVFKVVPQTFPMAVVSNLMTLGRFEWTDMVKSRELPVPDKNLICFRDSKGDQWSRFLNIAPTLGWIEYGDEAAVGRGPPEGVPTNDEAERLAFDCLFRLGIDRSLLCDKRVGYETVRGKLDASGHRLTTNLVSRGVSVGRQIDGVKEANFSFLIHFGDHGKIKDFILTWRNLLPFEAHPTATPDRIIGFIKAGKATIPVQDYDPSVSFKAKKLRIVKIIPQYFDKPGLEPLDFVYPYAVLEMAADTDGKTATFYLHCPLMDMTLK